MASRSRSRSPLQQDNKSLPGGRSSPTPSNASITSNNSKKGNRVIGKYQLKLINVPLHWKWHQVSNYIKRTTSPDKTIAEDITYISLRANRQHDSHQISIIMFKSGSKRLQAYMKLKQSSELVEGKKLFAHMINDTIKGVPNTRPDNMQVQKSRHQANDYISAAGAEDVNETYGLSIQYLTELGITPPLTRKVFVRYLPEEYNDESKIRSVFGMAGTLLSVTILKSTDYYNARLEYDHPVEAVQAVSMFNRKEVHSRILKCNIDSLSMRKKIDGMVSPLGPGLGPNGTPMLGVRVSVEVKKAKYEIMNEVHRLNETIDELKAQVMSLMQAQQNTPAVINVPNSLPNVVNPLQSAAKVLSVANPLQNVANPLQNVANPLQNVANPLAALGNLLTNQFQPMQLLQALLQQNTGNDTGVLGNMIQNMAGSNTDLSSLLQLAQANNQSGMQGNMHGDPSNMQGGLNMQIGPNMQGPSNNVPSGSFNNMRSGPQNTQGGPNNTQRGSNNMQSGPANNMQGGSNNMQSGPNNMQRGPNNMPSGPFNIQGGPANNMQSGPNNTQSGPNNMQREHNNVQAGPYNVQSGLPNMQRGPNNMQSGHNNMQSGPPNVQQGIRPFTQGQNNNTGFNMQSNQQSGFSNMQPGFSNRQPQSGQNEQINTGFGGPQFDNGQDSSKQSSTVLLFTNLPNTVTLQAMQAKMREVGEVKLVEMTGSGRALVSFYSNFEGEKCIRLFNQSKVDGQTIEVRQV